MKIKFDNRAKFVGKKADFDFYDWEIFVNESPQVLDNIDYVIYFLHKTFPNPVRTVNERANRFALKSRGWGEFQIGIQVVFKNHQIEQETHWLDLSRPWDVEVV